ncbi:hypothetical protein C8R45DRAFT_1136652 [Mycena sanguinolenta]|nr:hypothetical protein C8R45DRAFT_1136652 [Mycena sanguinolenta]
MPRVATTSTSLSQKPAKGGKVPPNPPLSLLCPQTGCPWSFSKTTDLRRHLPRHMSPEEREKRMYKCPDPGCTYKTLQKSNLQTHYNSVHTGLKPLVCKQCEYRASDPSTLHRHMRSMHAYVPGTAARRTKASASVSATWIAEPIPASPESDSSFNSWSASSSSSHSPSSSTHSDFPPTPTLPVASTSSRPEEVFVYNTPFAVTDALHASATAALAAASTSSADLSLVPVSPEWTWDQSQSACDAAAFHPCDAQDFCVDAGVGIASATAGAEYPPAQYPAEGIDFFLTGMELSEQQQQYDPECMFVPPLLYDPVSASYLSAFDFGFQHHMAFEMPATPFVREWAREFP